jgi:hypothetical protein
MQSRPSSDIQTDKAYQVVFVENSKFLRADQVRLNEIYKKLKHPTVILGAIGKQRTGKSTALNNAIVQITGCRDLRPFVEKECNETQTRGIHMYVVTFDEMSDSYKETIKNVYNQEIDILFLDCEGTESKDNVGTSKLYLLTFLMSSCIQIHVSKALDQGFASKIVYAFSHLDKIDGLLQHDKLELIRPDLYILLKDSNDLSLANAMQANPHIKVPEDLIRSFDNEKEDIYKYYVSFKHRGVYLVDNPQYRDDVGYVVEEPDTKYYRKLKEILNEMIFSTQQPSTRGSKSIELYFEKLLNVMNSGEVKDLISELEAYYQIMVYNQIYETLFGITKAVRERIQLFDPQSVGQQLKVIKHEHMKKLETRVKEMRCEKILQKIKDEIEIQVDDMIFRYQNEYKNVESSHNLQRENKAEQVKKSKTVTTDKVEKVEKTHQDIYHKYTCCGQGEENSVGCKTDQFYVGGNKLLKVVTLGLFGDPTKVTTNQHIGHYAKCCRKCHAQDIQLNTICYTDINVRTENIEIPLPYEKVYNMDLFNEKLFNTRALQMLNELMKKFEDKIKQKSC